MNPDVTMRAVEYALQGLSVRADVHAHNLANVNTPNFTARKVQFENLLAAALQNGARNPSAPQVVRGDGLPDGTGNTVEVETEIVGMLKDNIARDAMVNAYNFKVGVLRAGITGMPSR